METVGIILVARRQKQIVYHFFLAFGISLDIAVFLFGFYNLPLVLPILSRQTKKSAQALFFCLVETVGIEPMTSCMSSMRSNQLSYASVCNASYYSILFSKKQVFLKLFFGIVFWKSAAPCFKSKKIIALALANALRFCKRSSPFWHRQGRLPQQRRSPFADCSKVCRLQTKVCFHHARAKF